MERRLLTTREVAEILRTSTAGLANMRMRGESPPHLKFARKVLYDARDLEKWLDRHRQKTAEG